MKPTRQLETNHSASSTFHGLHVDNRPDGTLEVRKRGGVVYTPKYLADYVAHNVVKFYLSDNSENSKAMQLRILDPACGKGELLDSIWAKFQKFMPGNKYSANDVLCGIDIDKSAVIRTRDRIRQLVPRASDTNIATFVLNTNSLFPFNGDSSQSGWLRIKRKFGAESGFDIIIANPPWGADLADQKDRLSQQEFTLSRGQYDTSDLFIESAVSNLRDGGYLAFIVPDSLFSQEREALRELLLEKTEIRFIGRLGEKIFGGVNRACAIIICKKTAVRRNRKIRCLRLTPEVRKKVISGEMKLVTAEKMLSHLVPRSRFESNRGHRFNIDLTPREEKTLSRISIPGRRLGSHVVGSRGVELSKYGRVYECPACGSWAPFPTSKLATCPSCKTKVNQAEVDGISIVTKSSIATYRPIIVGECIQRYVTKDSYWIDTGKNGINYKSDITYKSPKILVRKTGVGISATIDYKDSLTNQVVYMFRGVEGNCVPLEFYLGVLSSRAVFFFTAKNHGETEWRSHPYVTQRQILDIPMRSLEELATRYAGLVELIGNTVRKHVKANTPMSAEDDAKIERAVARLYGLERSDYEIIFETIESAQDLIPVRALKNINIDMIFNAEAL